MQHGFGKTASRGISDDGRIGSWCGASVGTAFVGRVFVGDQQQPPIDAKREGNRSLCRIESWNRTTRLRFTRNIFASRVAQTRRRDLYFLW